MNARSGPIVVAGAGVFGAAAALELRGRGHRVTLLDLGELPHEGASSTDVSKMVRMDYGPDVFYHELAEAALEGWDRWNTDWPRPLYHETGFLILSREPMAPGDFEYESFRVLRERGHQPERFDATTLARRWPAWRAETHPDGYFNPRGGWVESAAVVARLLEACTEAGVEIRLDGFDALVERGGRVTGVRTRSGTMLEAELVITCLGAWTPTLLPWTAGLLRATAQPVLHFRPADPRAFRGVAFPSFAADIARSGWYGFPALPDGRLKIGHHGPGRETHPDARGSVDEGHVARARRFLHTALPALADAPLVGQRVCLYCDSFDGDPCIDHDPDRPGLVVAAGGSGHAFKFAPLLGPLIADVAEERSSRWAHRFRWRVPGARRTEAARYDRSRGPAPIEDPT